MKTKTAAALNLTSAACGLAGIILSFLVNGPSCFAMYTDQVALGAGIISIVLAVYLLRGHHRTMSRLRFASAIPQIVLIIAALISFLPVFTFPFNVHSLHLILMHFAAPALSLLSYFDFEPKAPLHFRDTFYAMIYTLIYAAAAIAVTAGGFYHSKAYPFLNYYPGHILAPVLQDLSILLAIYLIDLLIFKLKKQ